MILWLEDRDTTALSFIHEIKASGLKSFMVGTIEQFVTFLEDEPGLDDLVFVIDIMLPGVNDLNAIGISNALTGSGNRAGQVLVDRFLRAPDSRYLSSPVLFLTERDIEAPLREEVEALTRNGAGPVAILQKYVDEDLRAFVPKLREFLDYSSTSPGQAQGGRQNRG